MPIVRNIAEGVGYQPAPGERLLQLVNAGETQLYIGIRNGDYMIAAPAGEAQVTYVLVQEQWVRLQQQLKLQITYKNWIAAGLLTLVEVDELPEPEPPAEEPEAEPAPEEQPTPESEPAEEQPDAEPTPAPADPVPESEPAPTTPAPEEEPPP